MRNIIPQNQQIKFKKGIDMTDLNQIVPEVRIINIGKKILEEKEILPLSFTDQRKFLQIIVKFFVELAPKWQGSSSPSEVITDIKKILEDNIELLVEMVYDGDRDDFLAKMTNSQCIDLIDNIWEVNYQFPLEKGTMTFQKIAQTLKMSS